MNRSRWSRAFHLHISTRLDHHLFDLKCGCLIINTDGNMFIYLMIMHISIKIWWTFLFHHLFLWRDGNLQITIIIIQNIYHSDIYIYKGDVNIIIWMWYIYNGILLPYHYIAYIHHFEDVSPMSSRRAAAFWWGCCFRAFPRRPWGNSETCGPRGHVAKICSKWVKTKKQQVFLGWMWHFREKLYCDTRLNLDKHRVFLVLEHPHIGSSVGWCKQGEVLFW